MTDQDPDRPVDVDELAAWLGFSERAVRDCAQRGVLERSYGGRFPLQGSIQRYCAHLRELAVERGEGMAAAERARVARAQAEHADLKTACLRASCLMLMLLKAIGSV
jgi:phage terminase Nu1 subunit (DNA packaging protein)